MAEEGLNFWWDFWKVFLKVCVTGWGGVQGEHFYAKAGVDTFMQKLRGQSYVEAGVDTFMQKLARQFYVEAVGQSQNDAYHKWCNKFSADEGLCSGSNLA